MLKPGDEVVVLPSGMTSTIAGIDLFDQEIDEAFPPMSVTVRLDDDVDVSRGDMICPAVKNAPKPSQDIDAMICWMTNEPLRPRQKLAIKHTTRTGRALVKDIQYRLDVNTLHRDQETKELGLNEIGRVQLRTTVPLLCDPYSKNRTTGSFILIDEATGVTVGAGMIIPSQLMARSPRGRASCWRPPSWRSRSTSGRPSSPSRRCWATSARTPGCPSALAGLLTDAAGALLRRVRARRAAAGPADRPGDGRRALAGAARRRHRAAAADPGRRCCSPAACSPARRSPSPTCCCRPT